VLTPVQHPFLNNVLHTQLTPETADREISVPWPTSAQGRDRRLRWLSRISQPADLAERLLAHGLTYYEGVPGMAANLFGVA